MEWDSLARNATACSSSSRKESGRREGWVSGLRSLNGSPSFTVGPYPCSATDRGAAPPWSCVFLSMASFTNQLRILPGMGAENKMIVLVEDQPDQRQALKMALQRDGYAVRAARNGREALGLMAESPARVVITDIFMPD